MADSVLAVNPEDVTVRWKIFADLRSPLHGEKARLIFQDRDGPGIYRQFDADLRRAFVPRVLEPTKTFHQRVILALRRGGFEIAESRLPIRTPINPSRSGRLNLAVHLYPPSIVCLTITLDRFDGHDVGFDELIKLERVPERSALKLLVSSALHEFSCVTQDRLAETLLRTYPAMELLLPPQPQGFPADVLAHKKDLVAVLVRQSPADSLTNGLIDNVWSKCEGVNGKTILEHLLVDKQGMLIVRPSGTKARPVHRIRKVHDLAEICLSLGVFIDEYPGIHQLYPDYADFILQRARNWILDPSTQLNETVGHKVTFQLLLDEFGLPGRLKSVLDSMPSLVEDDRRKVFDGFASNWWRDPNFYEVLDGEVRASQQLAFGFVADPDMRRILARDSLEARRSRDGRNYKSAMVLAGSVIEAALLALLTSQDPQGEPRFVSFGLKQLLQEARRRNLLSPPPDVERYLDTVGGFRNLIHPGREKRTGTEPNQERANIAIAAMDLILQEINKARQ